MVAAKLKEHQDPRLSANDFAHYMVSSATGRMGILRRAKYPKSAPVIRYRDAREAICRYLADGTRSLNPLVTAESMLKQKSLDPAVTAFWQEDARLSIEALHALQGMGNQLGQYNFVSAPHNQPKLVIGGVEISVWADLLVHGTSKGQEQIGAAVLRMTQDDAATDSAKERRKDMGLYVATLARLHIEKSFQSNREPSNKLCLSIDIQHGEVFVAPAANSRRISDIENECRFISGAWPSI